MLLRFRATNFASLRDEQELSLMALDEHPDVITTTVPLVGERALPAIGIFGANASGKSNVLKAVEFARSAVIGSHQLWLPEDPIPRWPFRLDTTSRTEPSAFAFDFVQDDVRYEYVFSLDDRVIREETLRYWPRGKVRVLFERTGTEISFGPSLTGHKSAIAEIVRENSLFLSAAAANNHPQLRPIANWFNRLRWASDYAASPRDELDHRMLALMKYADIGVIGSMKINRQAVVTGRETYFVDVPGQEPLFTFDPSDDLGLPQLRRSLNRILEGGYVHLTHQAEGDRGEPLPWPWESSGTRSWLKLAADASRVLDDGLILIVDDLGSNLHPLLTAQLLGMFQSPRTNPHHAQLIFTGHDASLLGRHVEHRLHRDQVWLTAKDQNGATTLYPLTEYGRVRDGLDDIEGRYLQGRYGAVPFFDKEALREAAFGERE